MDSQLFYILSIFALLSTTIAVELTFELPDNAKQCFHEDIRQGVESTVEFQVFRKCINSHHLTNF